MSAFDNKEIEKYKAEAKGRWGQTEAFKEYAGKTKDYSQDKWNDLGSGMNGIFAEFALAMRNGAEPDSEEARKLVKSLQSYISGNFYHCSDEILIGLGQMYVADKRFKDNIDEAAAGTAEFVSSAIAAYCKK